MKSAKNKTFIFALILIGLIFAVIGVFNSGSMDNEAPKISINDTIYWNQKSPINLNISDNAALQSIKIELVDANATQIILNEEISEPKNSIDLNLQLPKSLILDRNRAYKLIIEAKDFGFFGGNTVTKSVNLIIDSKKPQIQIINQSYKITKGGSAVVVFRATDENLQNLYIESDGHIFKPTKFVKDGYWASLLAWNIQNPSFKAKIIGIHSEEKGC